MYKIVWLGLTLSLLVCLATAHNAARCDSLPTKAECLDAWHPCMWCLSVVTNHSRCFSPCNKTLLNECIISTIRYSRPSYVCNHSNWRLGVALTICILACLLAIIFLVYTTMLYFKHRSKRSAYDSIN